MKPTFRRGLTGVPPAMRKAVSREGTTSFSSWLWILPPNNGPISIAIRHWRQRLRRNPLNVQYTHLLSSSDRTLFLTVVYWVVMYSICCKKVAQKKGNLRLFQLPEWVNKWGGKSAYRGRVVGERLQVSDVGVNEPPSALDVRAQVVVCCVGHEYPQTNTYSTQNI